MFSIRGVEQHFSAEMIAQKRHARMWVLFHAKLPKCQIYLTLAALQKQGAANTYSPLTLKCCTTGA